MPQPLLCVLYLALCGLQAALSRSRPRTYHVFPLFFYAGICLTALGLAWSRGSVSWQALVILGAAFLFLLWLDWVCKPIPKGGKKAKLPAATQANPAA